MAICMIDRHPDYARMQVIGALQHAGIDPSKTYFAIQEHHDVWNDDRQLRVLWRSADGERHHMIMPTNNDEWQAFIAAIKLTL